jgi:hypothetical protein
MTLGSVAVTVTVVTGGLGLGHHGASVKRPAAGVTVTVPVRPGRAEHDAAAGGYRNFQSVTV